MLARADGGLNQISGFFYTIPAHFGVYYMNRTKPDRPANQIKPMKTATILIAALALCLGLVTGCAKKNSTSSESIQNPEVVARLRSFVAEKNDQTKLLVTSNGDPTPSELESFFVAADKQDWDGTTNNYSRIKRMVGSDARFRKSWWQATLETFGAMEQFTLGDSKYSALYADNIITSIPPGSVYFGGTDPGRFLITAMQRNQAAGDPFFTITQNALADGTYLDYLRSMYGSKLYIPTAEDSQKAFQEYTQDVAKRRQSNQLKSGEDVEVDPASGRVQVSGQVAVMEINGLLVKDIFEKNTNQEFYVEESFPLDWMYPYLEPHGIIFRLNRQPLTELSDEIVQSDHDYWTKTVTPMIGGWLNTGTTVKEVAAFAEKVFGRHDFSGFSGDPDR